MYPEAQEEILLGLTTNIFWTGRLHISVNPSDQLKILLFRTIFTFSS